MFRAVKEIETEILKNVCRIRSTSAGKVGENSMISTGGILGTPDNDPKLPGRRARHYILTEQPGPTPYARNINCNESSQCLGRHCFN